MSTETINQVWAFASSSSASVIYQTIRWGDGRLSCDCPGWTRRVQADGTRTCKHTRSVELGTANLLCVATNPPETIKIKMAKTWVTGKVTKQPKRKESAPEGNAPVRAITFED